MRSAHAPKACITGGAYITHKVRITFRKERITQKSPICLIDKLDFFVGGVGETRTLAPRFRRPTPLAGAPRHQLEYYSRFDIRCKYILNCVLKLLKVPRLRALLRCPKFIVAWSAYKFRPLRHFTLTSSATGGVREKCPSPT